MVQPYEVRRRPQSFSEPGGAARPDDFKLLCIDRRHSDVRAPFTRHTLIGVAHPEREALDRADLQRSLLVRREIEPPYSGDDTSLSRGGPAGEQRTREFAAIAQPANEAVP